MTGDVPPPGGVWKNPSAGISSQMAPAGWKDRMPRINLGLDLQGGVFLRLAVEIDKAIENTILRYADDARAVCREKGLPVLGFQKAGPDGFSLRFPPGDFATRAQATLKDEFPSLVYVSITPFGQTGPYRDYQGNSITAMALSGLMFLGWVVRLFGRLALGFKRPAELSVTERGVEIRHEPVSVGPRVGAPCASVLCRERRETAGAGGG